MFNYSASSLHDVVLFAILTRRPTLFAALACSELPLTRVDDPSCSRRSPFGSVPCCTTDSKIDSRKPQKFPPQQNNRNRMQSGRFVVVAAMRTKSKRGPKIHRFACVPSSCIDVVVIEPLRANCSRQSDCERA